MANGDSTYLIVSSCLWLCICFRFCVDRGSADSPPLTLVGTLELRYQNKSAPPPSQDSESSSSSVPKGKKGSPSPAPSPSPPLTPSPFLKNDGYNKTDQPAQQSPGPGELNTPPNYTPINPVSPSAPSTSPPPSSAPKQKVFDSSGDDLSTRGKVSGIILVAMTCLACFKLKISLMGLTI
ncbi:hypothetical protein KP509_13G019000 [Ceratopteris richardii]|uniref:Uncharacterized protein n=1 Tax=Ceratopteris richardii TaxID=49495 RepID=A0A8T2TJA2_CERRI|nr:hypothetical protein KP509_13G019000 [Ceratopteris richardii]